MRKIMLTAALASVLSIGPAYGQSDFWAGVTADVIGQTVANSVSGPNLETACLSGALPVNEAQLSRVRASAQQTMAVYSALARSGQSFNASSAFHRRHQAWVRAADGAEIDDVDTITDPIMHEVGGVLGQPDQFVHAGDARTAAGQWIVRGDSGQVVGSYLGLFRRDRGRWVLTRLEVDERDQEPTPLRPYCHTIGDVDDYLLQAANKAKPDETSATDSNSEAETAPAAAAPQ